MMRVWETSPFVFVKHARRRRVLVKTAPRTAFGRPESIDFRTLTLSIERRDHLRQSVGDLVS
jgi:hypothetical protein